MSRVFEPYRHEGKSDLARQIADSAQIVDGAHIHQINEEGIKAFWANLDEADWSKFHQEHGAKFPLNYSDALDELNFLSSVLQKLVTRLQTDPYASFAQSPYYSEFPVCIPDTIAQAHGTRRLRHDPPFRHGMLPCANARGTGEPAVGFWNGTP